MRRQLTSKSNLLAFLNREKWGGEKTVERNSCEVLPPLSLRQFSEIRKAFETDRLRGSLFPLRSL